MHARWALIAAAAAAFLAVAGSIPARAATSVWQPALPIAPSGGSPGEPAVALGARGEALAAWSAPTSTREGPAYRMQAKVRHGLRAPWLGPQDLSGPLASPPFPPALAVNARGDAVVLWQADGAVRSAVRIGWRGRWRRLSVPSGVVGGSDLERAFAPARVAVAPDGGAVAIWAARQDGAWVVRGARRIGPRAPWQETPDLALGPAPVTLVAPRLGMDAAGDAVVVRMDATGAVRVARRLGAGTWGPIVTLVDSGTAGADVALSQSGRTAAVWSDFSQGGVAAPLHVAVGEPGTLAWSAPETLPWVGLAPRVAINDRADLLVGWTEAPGPYGVPPGRENAVIRPAGGAWGMVGSAPGGRSSIQELEFPLVLDQARTGYAFSLQDDGSQGHDWPVWAMTGTASRWAPARRVPGSGDTTALALAAGPDGTALVLSRSAEAGTIYAQSYDRAPTVRLATSVGGRWVPRAHAVRWTVRVRNSGRIPARDVLVRIRLTGDGLLGSRPKPERHRAGPPRWGLGDLAPGASRAVVVFEPSSGVLSGAWVSVGVSAVARPLSWVQRQAKVPGR